MKVFISWSGTRSRMVAEALQVWLRRTIQASSPWLSTDTEKGTRWNDQVSDELEKSGVGISCLTPENLDNPWILFEAGAIAKTKTARVCTLLLDLLPRDVLLPLGQFQHTLPTRNDVRQLLATINNQVERSGEKRVEVADLDAIFHDTWDALEAKLLAAGKAADVPAQVRRSEDLLDEILYLVKSNAEQLTAVRRERTLRRRRQRLGDILARAGIRNLSELRKLVEAQTEPTEADRIQAIVDNMLAEDREGPPADWA